MTTEQRIVEVAKRAATATAKIRERVKDITIPNMATLGELGERWLNSIQVDFYTLVDNSDDEVGRGNYADWTPAEIKELYKVLYGEDMDA